jgi:NAD(P)-dependent dehydrogenase (short-subunit alcohol dehydrogenase family)
LRFARLAGEIVSREPELAGQTLVVIGGSSGIGLETARRARTEGADVVLTGRNPERLEHAAREIGALRSEAFDATDFERLDRFFDALPTPIDHLMVSSGGPYYSKLADIDFARARRNVDEHFWLALQAARLAVGKVRPEGTLLFIGGTGGRRPAAGALIAAFTAAMPALVKALALDLAPVRVNLIAPGVVGPVDIAALAVHLMTNTAVTGAVYDIDGGQQLVEG